MVFGLVLYAVLVLGAFVAFLGGLFGVFEAFDDHRDSVDVRNVPPSDLDAAAVGRVAFTGTVVSDAPLSAPTTGADCVAYDLTVRDVSGGSSARHVDEFVAADFGVTDGETTVRVAAERLTLDLTDDRREEYSYESYEEPPAPVASLNRRRELPSPEMGASRSVDCEWLEPGDEVYVNGRVEYDETGDGEKPLALVVGDRPPLVSNKSRERLRSDRRHALARSVLKETAVSAAGLAFLLWATPLRALF